MKNKPLKRLRDWFREQYAGLVESYQQGKLCDEDIEHYLETVPNSFEVLDNYKKEQVRKQHIENYKKVVNNKTILPEQLKEQAENTLKLLTEEFEMTQKDYALEPAKALNKYNKLNRLQKRIEETETTIDVLNQITEQLQPPKRKPGRPKKTQNANDVPEDD